MNKPDWWLKNPYPEDIFSMTVEDYIKIIPDEKQRTVCLRRLFWTIASEMIFDAYTAYLHKNV